MDIGLLVAHFSSSSTLIPFLIGISNLKVLSRQLRWLLAICFSALIADSTSLFLMMNSINNWPVLNLFSIVQITLFLIILDIDLKINWHKYLLFLFVLFAAINLFFVQSINSFNSYSSYLGAVLLITFSLVYLYRLLRDLPTIDIYKFPPLWVVFAILIYYGGTLFLFLFNNYLLSLSIVSHKAIWILHNSLNILKNLLFALALWQHYRNVRLSR